MSGGQDPVFHRTPVKPSRQPSRIAPRRTDPHTDYQDGFYDPSAQSDYSRPNRPAVMPNPHDIPSSPAAYAPAYPPAADPYGHEISSGLRQRSGDSISRNHGGYGANAMASASNYTLVQPGAPYAYPSSDSPSLYDEKAHNNYKPAYEDDYSSAPYSSPAYPPAQSVSNYAASANYHLPPDPPYETIAMNGMHGNPYQQDPYGAPPLPYQNTNANGSFYSSEYHGNKSEFGAAADGVVGGFVGLGAPGTMLVRPQQQAAYIPDYDPNAFESARKRMLRRRTVKKIALTNGNLVLDVPVPGSICRGNQSDEFRTMRYTAATCDPNNWGNDRFALRSFLSKRQTELAVCMTCYNEDEELLFRTLGATIRNIGYLQSRSKSKTWGPNSWTKAVVFIVGDGRKKANERMLKMLSCYGIFQEGAMKDHVLDKEVTAHIFELTTQVIVDPRGGVEVSECPVQLVFCLKEKNQKKINSHRWFFNAFCQQLQPNVTILLDVGTMPTDRSLYYLWKAFDKNKKVAGACGEIAVDVGTMGWRLYNPLVAAQNFEYKMSNILDKPLESVFGFIAVLPGAFSAYRWQALKGRPLDAYFKGEALHNGTLEGGSFINNLYLAEDRILCFELVVKSHEAWILKYVKSAKATTDVPDGVAELIAQRRRWLNGSLFASMFSLIHFGRIWTSGQSFLRKLALQLQVLYNLVQMVFTWTSLANWYLAMYFLMKSSTSNPKHDPFAGQGKAVFDIVLNVYIALVVVITVASLGSRPQGFRFMYLACILLFGTYPCVFRYLSHILHAGALFCLLLYCIAWTIYLQLDKENLFQSSGWTTSHILHLLVTSSNIRSIVISIVATYVLYLAASLWMLDPWHMLTCFPQSLFLQPTWVTILSIYSLANLHDVSWGTKGSDAASSDLGGVKGEKGKTDAVVEVKVPTSASDADELWHHAQADLARKPVEQKQHRSKAVKQTDQQQNFRTKFLLFWLGTNAALIIVFTSSFWDDFTQNDLHLTTNPYLSFLFWSLVVLSAIRALGSLTYLVFRLFGH